MILYPKIIRRTFMTQYEYEKIVAIIEKNMTVVSDNMNSPRIVLTQRGFAQSKEEIKSMVEVIK